MPSYLDFDTTKQFRDFIIGKTLTVPNGPQSFTNTTYTVQSTGDMSNVDPGAVDTNRQQDLLQPQTSNVFKPDDYSVTEYIETIPRKANLDLYPYFVNGQYHSFVSIISTSSYETESELMKFAAWNIKENPEGPFFARLQQNLYTATVGRVRLIDALEGNSSTAINIITGKEPLIEKNNKISVASHLVGKGIDFLQQLGGVEFPWAEIPGDYLSNPKNPTTNFRPTATSELGKVWQDTTGALGSLLGIQRRPTTTRKPSDLFIEYMGNGPKSALFDNLSYSTYAPDYTTSAMSQNTSKLFNYVDQFAEGFKNMLGLEAPKGKGYIGDDRGNDVKYAMGDFNDRPVRSNYYLSLLFDPIQTELFTRKKNIGEGGGIGGKLTWISSKSKNKLGANNDEYSSEESQFNETLSTNYPFREDSILGVTQEILETMPTDGGASRSHVANVIDQTSRIFREGDVMISRGSAVKYINNFTKAESGVEYCRVWTKDRSYMNNSDTMKKTTTSRKFESSILSTPWNINIYPNSNGNGGFDGSTNIAPGGFNNKTNKFESGGSGFYAKKYMFSIENLAWKSSNRSGFSYSDLPYCERGPNGGRVMWFPPYDLKVSENNSAKWEENAFLGRPEPVYTYSNTTRTGQISFKVIVDHPSILNLLVKSHFKGMSDEEADNYINAFFAGCVDVDFYSLVRKYTTLTPDDVISIQSYLNENKDAKVVEANKGKLDPIVPVDTVVPKNEIETRNFSTELYYYNDTPNASDGTNLYTSDDYQKMYDNYMTSQPSYLTMLNHGLNILEVVPTNQWGQNQQKDYRILTGLERTVKPTAEFPTMISDVNGKIADAFTTLQRNYTTFTDDLAGLKYEIGQKRVKEIRAQIGSTTSPVYSPDGIKSSNYNLKLSYRRSDSIIKDILNKISKNGDGCDIKISWKETITDSTVTMVEPPIEISLKDLGYEDQDGKFIIKLIKNTGEQGMNSRGIDCSDVNNPNITQLKITAPNTFYCRESTVKIDYTSQSEDTPVEKVPILSTSIPPKSAAVVAETSAANTTAQKTPPIDQMKVIIMKTLSECAYFKKLEEDSPSQFSSLKEKLRYFHPAFHSMTPEGLNARLTFLHQCIRPGDTLPVKERSDQSDLNARNTTFGPPPILIMRIGDFYHSKIIVRDYNVDFEQNLWDMNPEGIGVQPMIANVTLQVSFIGGHGLAKPVEQLQNALSSNFYANTEMYDPRSTSTETTIAGEDAAVFTKKFLEGLMDDYTAKTNQYSQEVPPTETKITEGYIGKLGTNTLEYTSIVEDLYIYNQGYFKKYREFYNFYLNQYDLRILSMMTSPTYRVINNYNVETGGGTESIQLLGEYKSGQELEILVSDFKGKILSEVATANISTIFGLDRDLTSSQMKKSEDIIKPEVVKIISDRLDGLPQSQGLSDIIEERNKLIVLFDKLNFITGEIHDGKINMKKKEYTGVNFNGFDSSTFYDEYSSVVEFIKDYQDKFTEDLDESYTFSRYSTLSANDLSYFLSVLLKLSISDLMVIYQKYNLDFSERTLVNIEKRLKKFLMPYEENDISLDLKNFRIKKYPARKNGTKLIYNIQDETYEFSDGQKTMLENVHRTSSNKTKSVLNYWR